jgi:uncharacterized protein (DUF302 family)
MRYFSRCVTMGFERGLAATKQALDRHRFAILAEIDLASVIKAHLAVDFRPYLILSTCSLQLAQRAIEAEDEIGSIVLCHVVVQEHSDGRVEISAADPDETIGMINHVELIEIAKELRCLLQQAIYDIESAEECEQPTMRGHEEAGRALARAPVT